MDANSSAYVANKLVAAKQAALYRVIKRILKERKKAKKLRNLFFLLIPSLTNQMVDFVL